ncbi:AGC/AKT protein kinase Sck2 [Schizosaccharomyces cryophilus OY26]|uniref:non-specific serine/threonine protein kinase n=1 Tax=Schizosaccharomyces cryophilus (strain OY26 / ATCC MYA-4695 / CBS 11777 / NBRC 106824 / NRRL Y48691) TaxID=653667 RepID=S9W3U2_SCHCR|nr:AGC/AKT protein kinase Sck2 [Schizosaccharomyces cryophilus OY26]EPY52615.1 AGC/AKT protein kinase Sck2 [Schizosaccharomyces cryophilus OY26]
MKGWTKSWFGLSKKATSNQNSAVPNPEYSRSPLTAKTNHPLDGNYGAKKDVSSKGAFKDMEMSSAIPDANEDILMSGGPSTVDREALNSPSGKNSDILPEVDHEPSGYLKLKIDSLKLEGNHTDAAMAMECTSFKQLFLVIQFGTSEYVSPPLKWKSSTRDTAISIPSRDSSAAASRASSMLSNFTFNTSTMSYCPTSSTPNPSAPSHVVFDVAKRLPVELNIYDHSRGNCFVGKTVIHPCYDYNQYEQYSNRVEVSSAYAQLVDLRVQLSSVFQPLNKKSYGPEDFEPLKLIGKGTFGQVYLVRKKDTRRVYAMKILSKKVIVRRKEVTHTIGERDILVQTAAADSPFIVALRFSFQTPKDLYLVTDYMAGGELFWHLQKSIRFPEARAKFYIAELLLALQALHKRGIVYRDLKPENILLDVQGHIALCDFGLSKANLSVGSTTRTFCGTTDYLAPEVILDEGGYDMMVDFWSLGVLLYEMTCGWSPFYAENTQQLYKNIVFGKVRFPRGLLSAEARDLIKLLLNRNAKNRLGAHGDAEEVKRHSFFADINWEELSAKRFSPPFKPIVEGEFDVSNFDVEFTNKEVPNDFVPVGDMSTSAPLSSTVQNGFKGFTYVDSSQMDEAYNTEPGSPTSSVSSFHDDYHNQDFNRTNDDFFMDHIDP